MFRPRVIPILLLRNLGLVKSVRFKDHKYIGDPINAVKIFNDLRADELAFLDILASKEKRKISLEFVSKVGNEANMPFSVGGGIRTLKDIKDIINAGAEKAIINSYAAENPQFIKEASEEFGSSTIVVSMDVNKKFLGKKQVFSYSGEKDTGRDPVEFAQCMENMGAGELIVTSIEKEGRMEGYDIDLIKSISQAVAIPVVANGGAATYKDFTAAVKDGHASAVAAGSMFVYHGARKAVLINYPYQKEIFEMFK
jgi:cyclase